MMVRFSNWLSWQFIAMVVTAAGVGGAVAALAVILMSIDNINELATALGRQTARVQLLESLVMQRTAHDVVALDIQAAPGSQPAAQMLAADGAAVSAHVLTGPRSKAGRAAKSAQAGTVSGRAPADVPATEAARVSRQVQAKMASSALTAEKRPAQQPNVSASTSGDPPPLLAAAPAPIAPVTGEEVIAAMRTARVEGVSAEKAGVRAIDRGSVQMRNGTTVRLGERFASGEKLLLIDGENGRLVTDQRQLLLFFQSPTGGRAPTTTPNPTEAP